jgi:hypothetical protein
MKKSALFSFSQQWSAGLTKHGTALQLVHYPASPLNSHLGNARQTELVYQTSRSVTLAVSNALITARSTAVIYLEKARASLKPFLGERWTTAWAQTGFTNNSLQLPRTNTSDVLALVRAMQSYLTANAAQQNTAAGITAVAAGALITSLESGVTALKDAKKDQRTKRDSRDSTQKTLTDYLHDSRKEVESVLDEGDSRWLDFIDEVPGDLSAPEAVSALVAEPGLPGHVRLSFIDSLRAEAYGVYVSHGAGQPFVHVLTIHDTVADLVLTPGIDVRIRVKASNAAGQSAFSPVAEVTVPVALAEAA